MPMSMAQQVVATLKFVGSSQCQTKFRSLGFFELGGFLHVNVVDYTSNM